MTSTRVASSARRELAFRLGLGALVLIAAAAVFGAIADNIAPGDSLTLFDVEVARWLRAHARPDVTTWMLAITHLHSTFAVSCYGLAAALAFAVRRQWRIVATIVVCLGGGLLLNLLMKLAFQRARPVLDDPLLTLTTYSFPSGHVAGSTLMYGLVVAWIFARSRRPALRVAAVTVAALMIVVVAFTRMYLGVHYLSDVVAAFAEGVAWLALCLTALATFWRRAPMGAAPSTAAERVHA